MTPRQRRVRWSRSYRIIPSRYPPIDLFERIGDPSEWEVLAEIEGRTNDRLRDQIGDISVVSNADRIAGPGASAVMASFTHRGPSRFSDGSFGVYYAGESIGTSIAETAYHRAEFLARTAEPSCRIELRAYIARIDALLHDVRKGFPGVHAADDWGRGQALGFELQRQGSDGVLYKSVRRKGGECIGAFRPRVIRRTRAGYTLQGPHLYYRWDGKRIVDYLVVGEMDWKPVPA